MLPIFEGIFNDNCAHYSDLMRPWYSVQLGLAWFFCIVLVVGVLGYFACSTQNRNSSWWQQDACITATAFVSTVVVAAVWIGGMASLFFVMVYIIAICVVYFGCIHGVDMPQQHTDSGLVQNMGNASSDKHATSTTSSDEHDIYAASAPLLENLPHEL
jgi:hypothetical protein